MDPLILTTRLKMDRLGAADAPALHAYRSLPEVCLYQGFNPGSLQDSEGFIRSLGDFPFGAAGTWFQFAIRRRESGELVGDLGAHFLGDAPRQVEIGFSLAPAWQGQGLAGEAVTALISHLFAHQDTHRVMASVDPRNTASVALLRRVGFRQEAHHRRSLWFKGEWVDDMLFAVLKEEWNP